MERIVNCVIVDKYFGNIKQCIKKLELLKLPTGIKLDVIAYVGDYDVAALRNKELGKNDYIMCVNAAIREFDVLFIEKALYLFERNESIGIVGLYENNIFNMNYMPIADYKYVSEEKFVYAYVPAIGSDMYITRVSRCWKEKIENVGLVDVEYCLRVADEGVKVVSLLWDGPKGNGKDDGINIKCESEEWRYLFQKYSYQYIKVFVRKNYYMYENIKAIAQKNDDLNEKIKWLEFAAQFATFNFVGIYSDRFIEDELHDISSKYLETEINIKEDENKISKSILHILTEVYETGGHTRVVYNWIKNDKDHIHYIILTSKSHVPKWLSHAVFESGGKIININNDVDYLIRAKMLYYEARKFEHVVLHIHPYDVIPLLAFSHRKQRTPILFFKHSGHTFFIGIGIADVIVNFPEDSLDFIKKRRGVINNKLAVITLPRVDDASANEIIRSEDKIKLELGIPLNAKVLASMAPSWRYTKMDEDSFDNFSLRLINYDPKLYIVIIGPSIEDIRWDKLKKLSRGRILPVGLKSKLEVKEIFSITSLYIDSFRFGSPGAIIDAAKFGLPVLSISSTEVWMRKFLCNGVDELLSKSIELLEKGSEDFLKLQQQSYYEQYNKMSCHRSLNALYEMDELHKYNQFEYVFPEINSDDELAFAEAFNRSVTINKSFFTKFSAENQIKIIKLLYEIYMQENMYPEL